MGKEADYSWRGFEESVSRIELTPVKDFGGAIIGKHSGRMDAC